MTIRKTELIRAGKELNNVLGLDPQIMVNDLRISELKTAVLEASELIDPNDKINRRTLSLIADLKAELEVPEDMVSEEEEQSVDEPGNGSDGIVDTDVPENTYPTIDPEVPLDEPAEEDEVDEEPAGDEPVEHDEGTEEIEEPVEEIIPSEKPAKKAKKQKTPKSAKTTISWAQALARAIIDTEGQEFDADEIIASAVTQYEMANNRQAQSDEGARAQWRGSRYVLQHLGVIHPAKYERRQLIVYTYQRV